MSPQGTGPRPPRRRTVPLVPPSAPMAVPETWAEFRHAFPAWMARVDRSLALISAGALADHRGLTAGGGVYAPRVQPPLEVTDEGIILNPQHPRFSMEVRRLTEESSGVPIGGIIIWAGSLGSIPTGWSLCDGAGGTPDLSACFLMGVDTDGLDDEDDVGDTGGCRWHGMTENNHPNHQDHKHTNANEATVQTIGAAFTKNPATSVQKTTGLNAMELRHGGIVNSWPAQSPTAEEHAYADTDNRPPYYAVAFIQRIA